MDHARPAGSSQEIERVFLLRGMPTLPAKAAILRIEQGYLPFDAADRAAARDGQIREGRIRRITYADGRILCVHTIKSGQGRVRTEFERPMTRPEFDQVWPETLGRRISKTRHVVPDGELKWEIDRFDNIDLVLAEIELPTEDTPVTPPPWLAPHIVREVTEEPEFRNFSIAMRLAARRESNPR